MKSPLNVGAVQHGCAADDGPAPLEEFGFTPWFQRQIDPSAIKDYRPLRVTAIHKGWCDLSDGIHTRPAKTTGKLRREARATQDYLTVGDWILATNFAEGSVAMIHSVLERQNVLQRKTAGKKIGRQLLAANLDTAFVIHTLDQGFNVPKLERYLSIVHDSGIEPIILLSKSDLPPRHELKKRITEVTARMPNTPVFAFSNTTRSGLKTVQALFERGKTYGLLGASGVGKTSLINSLLGEEDAYFTLPVREKDGKGIHTTTWRELIVLNNGALVIDTPGMRELGHLDTAGGIDETFDEILALAGQCTFRDCGHSNTPGCAVLAAVEAGSVATKRYDNFIRMRKETADNERALRQQKWKNK